MSNRVLSVARDELTGFVDERSISIPVCLFEALPLRTSEALNKDS